MYVSEKKRTYRTTDRTENNRISLLRGVERLVGQGRARSIDGGTAEEMILEVEGDVVTGSFDDLESLEGFNGDFGTAVVAAKNDDVVGGHGGGVLGA